MIRLVANGWGLGDAVVLTAVLRALREFRSDEQVTVSSAWPGVFRWQSNVVAHEPWDSTSRSFPELDTPHPGVHQIAIMLDKLGVLHGLDADLRPYVYSDMNAGAEVSLVPQSYLTISTTPGAWTRNKDWIAVRWQRLADVIQGEMGIRVVQVGSASDLVLDGCSEYIFDRPIEQVAWILRHARVHVAPVTGTMHLATGVGTPVVALFMGREDPAVTGYFCNTNLVVKPERGCSPCWLVEPCPYLTTEGERECADGLTGEDVLWAVIEEVTR